MDQQNNNPTTAQHDKLANQLMQDLGFEWDTDEKAWMPPEEPVLQQEATDALKGALNEYR